MLTSNLPLESSLNSLRAQIEKLAGLHLHTLTPRQARQRGASVNQILSKSPENLVKVENCKIKRSSQLIPLRLYTPKGSGPFPVLVYFHGGGWVLGSLDTYDSLCSSIAERANCVVVSVDYPLAPEHPFPKAVDTVDIATQWVVENAKSFNGDPQRIAVGGDSAGGNLAAVVARRFRDRGQSSLIHQLLIYPVTNLDSLETDSYKEFAEDFFLSKDDMVWFRHHYLPKENQRLNPDASPLLADDFQGLPPTHLILAEIDVLKDDGANYAAKLAEAGVTVKCQCYEGMIHGFLRMDAVFEKVVTEAIEEIAANLRVVFAD